MNTVSEIITAIATVALFIVGFFQLQKFNKQVKAELLYKIYEDLLEWLKTHKEAKEWVYGGRKLSKSSYEKWEVDDLLGYFEAIWTFDKQGLIDKDTTYDLFSDYLIEMYEANNFELRKMISKFRSDEGKPDLYRGVELLYKRMKQREIASM